MFIGDCSVPVWQYPFHSPENEIHELVFVKSCMYDVDFRRYLWAFEKKYTHECMCAERDLDGSGWETERQISLWGVTIIKTSLL